MCFIVFFDGFLILVHLKFTSEKPFLAFFPVLVLIITVVHALTVVQLIHECLALLEVFLLCFVLFAGVVAGLVA